MMNMLAKLLGSGYLPPQLPITFISQDFGNNSNDIIEDWKGSQLFWESRKSIPKNLKRPPGKKNSPFDYKLKYQPEPECISAPKTQFERRIHHIVHPIPQALLSREISNNWDKIEQWLRRQIYSVDSVRYTPDGDRAIKQVEFALHVAKKQFISSTSDWLVETDIMRFYPTIYTHSITWAAYGKERVKGDLNNYRGSLADRLDQLVRAGNRNQTVGIPVGPDTSRVLAEIISARVDQAVSVSEPMIAINVADRMQDDWLFGATSLEDANRQLANVMAAYSEYGLEVNGGKTSIQHISNLKRAEWKPELRARITSYRRSKHQSDLEGLLNTAIEMQQKFPAQRVIGYTIAALQSYVGRFSDAEVSSIEAFLLNASVISPISLQDISYFIINLSAFKASLSYEFIHKRFSDLAEAHISKGHSFEAIWLLYTLRGLKKPIKPNLSKRMRASMEGYKGSVVPLIALDMHDAGILKGLLPKEEWEHRIDLESIMSGGSWLLAYEGIRNGWLRDRHGLGASAFFKPMLSRNVKFYDRSRSAPTVKSIVRKRVARVSVNRALIASMLTRIRFEESRDNFSEFSKNLNQRTEDLDDFEEY